MGTNFKMAASLTILLVVTFVAIWELYIRSLGVGISYNDDIPLWANKRSQAYDATESTFFLGPSRIKFDIDLPTWENLTGEKAVQLAMVGTSPQLILKDLANDEKFKGKLIIDITEFIIFSRTPRDEDARKGIEYYKNITPAQWTSFHINHLLESKFVFLDSRLFSLNGLLNYLHFSNRHGVEDDVNAPIGFEPATFDRQNIMSDKFISDTTRQIAMKNIWKNIGMLDIKMGITGDTLQNIFRDLKISIDKIKLKGGQVMFIHPPSSGEMRAAEKVAYPREIYWDNLLRFTNTQGIHFEDYPGISDFTCPEWSHLSPKDARVFTRLLILILQKEKNWTFPNKQITASVYTNSKTFYYGI